MKMLSPEKTQHRKAERAKFYAATSSLGYNALGATFWMQPGVLPKLIGAGLAVKGTRDYTRAYDMDPIIAPDSRQRLRSRFNSFMEVWSNNEGTSLKDRLKRRVGQ